MMLDYLKTAGVTEEALVGLQGAIRIETYAPGEAVVRQGELAPNLFFLVSGLVKLVYVNAEGNEYIKSFISEGGFFGSLVSTLAGGESTFSIVALEPVTVEVAPYETFNTIASQHVSMLRVSSAIFQNIALKKEIREYELLCLTPGERYERFLAENPRIASRVTQALIARYLGITPVALSRIKSRLAVDL